MTEVAIAVLVAAAAVAAHRSLYAHRPRPGARAIGVVYVTFSLNARRIGESMSDMQRAFDRLGEAARRSAWSLAEFERAYEEDRRG